LLLLLLLFFVLVLRGAIEPSALHNLVASLFWPIFFIIFGWHSDKGGATNKDGGDRSFGAAGWASRDTVLRQINPFPGDCGRWGTLGGATNIDNGTDEHLWGGLPDGLGLVDGLVGGCGRDELTSQLALIVFDGD
jgi:hypothetical protein